MKWSKGKGCRRINAKSLAPETKLSFPPTTSFKMSPAILHVSGYGGSIYTLAFDPTAASLTKTSDIAAGKAPTWITRHPSKDVLYTGDEFADVGTLHAYRVGSEGELELFSTKKTGRAATGPVHIVIKEGDSCTQLYTSNYSGASLSSLRLEADGSFRKTDREDELLKFVGAGPKVSSDAPEWWLE